MARNYRYRDENNSDMGGRRNGQEGKMAQDRWKSEKD